MRQLALAIASTVLACGNAGGGTRDTELPTGASPAEGSGAAAGLTGYAVSTAGSSATIQLLGPGGLGRGSVTVSPSATGLVVTATVGGATAIERIAEISDDTGTWVLRVRESGGATLRTETRLDIEENELSSVLLVASAAAPTPEPGLARETTDGRYAVFPLSGEGAVDVEGASVAAWVAATGAGPPSTRRPASSSQRRCPTPASCSLPPPR